MICYHVYHRSLLVFFSVAKPRSAKLTEQQKKNNGTSVDTWQVQFVPRQNSGSLAYVAGLKRKRLVRRGELKGGVYPYFFLFMPVACTANRYINKLVYLTSRIMGTANFFPLQTSQSTDETLALKKIVSVIFQSLSFKFLHSINLIDQVDLKTV